MIARKLIFGFATISLAFALAACGTVPLTPDTLPTFAPIAPQVAPTATDMPTTLPTPAPLADTSITFAKTGGIAGISDTLKISPDLKVVYTSRNLPAKQTLISADQYNKLLAQIDKADFFNLKDTYAGAAPDAFVYAITVAEPARTKTVSTSETSEMPQELQDLIGQLKAIQNNLP